MGVCEEREFNWFCVWLVWPTGQCEKRQGLHRAVYVGSGRASPGFCVFFRVSSGVTVFGCCVCECMPLHLQRDLRASPKSAPCTLPPPSLRSPLLSSRPLPRRPRYHRIGGRHYLFTASRGPLPSSAPARVSAHCPSSPRFHRPSSRRRSPRTPCTIAPLHSSP